MEPTNCGARLAQSLMAADDLDCLQALFVSNEVADQSGALQLSMLRMVQAERRRRGGEECDGLPLPAFSVWHPVNLILSGPTLISACEAAAIAGDPTVMEFSFRLLQYWFLEFSKRYTETLPCEND